MTLTRTMFSRGVICGGVIFAALTASTAWAQSPAADNKALNGKALEGKAIAFDRGKGNCLSCHAIKGGDLPGTIGPELKELKARYDRQELIAIVTDETQR